MSKKPTLKYKSKSIATREQEIYFSHLTREALTEYNYNWRHTPLPSIGKWYLSGRHIVSGGKRQYRAPSGGDIASYLSFIFYIASMSNQPINDECAYFKEQFIRYFPKYTTMFKDHMDSYTLDSDGYLNLRFYPGKPDPILRRVPTDEIEGVKYDKLIERVADWLTKLLKMVREINFIAMTTNLVPVRGLYRDRKFNESEFNAHPQDTVNVWWLPDDFSIKGTDLQKYFKGYFVINQNHKDAVIYPFIREGIILIDLLSSYHQSTTVNYTEKSAYSWLTRSMILFPIKFLVDAFIRNGSDQHQVIKSMYRTVEVMYSAAGLSLRTPYPVIYHPIAEKLTRGYGIYHKTNDSQTVMRETHMEQVYQTKLGHFIGNPPHYLAKEDTWRVFGDNYKKDFDVAMKKSWIDKDLTIPARD